MKYPKENNEIVKWNHQRNKWNSYEISLVIEWNSRWNCLVNLWNCFEIAWQTYEKWKIAQPLELWNSAYKEWDISLMHVALYTIACRHLPHFYHKSGHHQSPHLHWIIPRTRDNACTISWKCSWVNLTSYADVYQWCSTPCSMFKCWDSLEATPPPFTGFQIPWPGGQGRDIEVWGW